MYLYYNFRGSLFFLASQVVQKLCTFQRLWKEGNTKQIQQEISSAPTGKLTPCVKSKAATSDSDSDDDDADNDEKEADARALCNGHHKVIGGIVPLQVSGHIRCAFKPKDKTVTEKISFVHCIHEENLIVVDQSVYSLVIWFAKVLLFF